MALLIPQSTSFNRPIYLGATGLSPTVLISQNGGSFNLLSGSFSEISNGWYLMALNSTDTSTLGSLAYYLNAGSGIPDTWLDQVVPDLPGGSVTSCGTVGSVTGNVGGNVVGSVASVTGNVGGNVVGTVGGVTGDVQGTVQKLYGTLILSGSLSGSGTTNTVTISSSGVGNTDMVGMALEIVDASGKQVRTITAASFGGATWDLTVDRDFTITPSGGDAWYIYGTTLPKLDSSLEVTALGDGGDPWATSLPGSYSSGQAGYIVGNSLPVTSISGSVGSVTGSVGSVAGNVAGNLNGNVSGNVFGNVVGVANFVTSGQFQAGSSGTSVKLANAASSVNNVYDGYIIAWTPTGSNDTEYRTITAYNGTTKIATIDSAFGQGNPSNGNFYRIAAVDSSSGGSDPWTTTLPGSYSSGQAGYIVGTNLDAQVSTRAVPGDIMKVSSGTGANQVSLSSGQVTAGTVNDKTGYALSSTGLDSIPVTAPSTVASSFREMIVQLWRRFYKKAVYDTGTTTLKTFADNNTTVVTTQTLTDTSGVQTQGPAS